ncbi:MAG TPA: TlpA disulfide reductase family protein [Actinomycetales bacterium]|nr:TlpA disulfide reductase family protein [Actinomycetales bacterium]
MRLLTVTLLAALVLVSGCTSTDPLSAQARAGDDKNYVAGDGTAAEIAPDERGEPVTLAGATAEGERVALADWRGDVVVLNIWYAACAPCRAEAPDLAEVSGEYADVRFLGINTRDGAAQAKAFQRTFDLEYPSILDASDGAALLALRGEANPRAVPTTLVLDTQGRVAARIVGLAEGSVLTAMLDRVLEEE